jgi:hypothetical protein
MDLASRSKLGDSISLRLSLLLPFLAAYETASGFVVFPISIYSIRSGAGRLGMPRSLMLAGGSRVRSKRYNGSDFAVAYSNCLARSSVGGLRRMA